MAKFCAWCGKQIDDADVFCAFCGRRADGSDAPQPQAAAAPTPPRQPVQQPAPQPPQQWQQPAPQQPQWQAPQPPQAPPPKKGGKAGLIIGIAAAVVVVAAVLIGGFVWPGFFKSKDGGKTDGPGTEEVSPEPKPTKAPKDADTPKATKAPKETEKPAETPAPTPEPTPAPTPEPPYMNPFTDAKESDWYYDALMWAGKNGVVTGLEFKPNDNATRGQALTFIWRAAGEPEPNLKVSPFSDVKEDDWYFKPVLWGFENSLISTGDGQFRAGDDLTRAQAVTFLCRAREGKARSAERYFWDVTSKNWYFDAVNWALESGIVGRDDSYAFYPDRTLTRAGLITMLYRAFDPTAPRANTTPPNQSSFAALGINADVDNFGPKNYNTVTKNGKAMTYSATVVDYRVFEEDDGFPKQDGYEYRIMTVDLIRLTDGDGSGITHLILYNDFYNSKLYSDSKVIDDNDVATHTVLYNGELVDYTIWRSSEAITGGLRITYTATVPKGYDGVVVGVRNASLSFYSNQYLSDIFNDPADFAFFRMN